MRVPVAWDTYAVAGRIQPDKFQRVAEVIDWITDAGLFAVLNIHWDGGWIDSSNKEKYPADQFARFTPEAEKKYRGYWEQIARFFAGKNEKLLFEALNEETNFSNEGSEQKAYATLTRVQQIFVDTVRGTGGNNAKRLLIVAGYHTDIAKTCSDGYQLPRDTIPRRLFISAHYYTPWQFCGLTEDADWGKVMPTWGTQEDVTQLNELFDKMAAFTAKHGVPAFIGEFGVEPKKEPASRVRWMTAVVNAGLSRKMVPVLWDTGNDPRGANRTRRAPRSRRCCKLSALASERTVEKMRNATGHARRANPWRRGLPPCGLVLLFDHGRAGLAVDLEGDARHLDLTLRLVVDLATDLETADPVVGGVAARAREVGKQGFDVDGEVGEGLGRAGVVAELEVAPEGGFAPIVSLNPECVGLAA